MKRVAAGLSAALLGGCAAGQLAPDSTIDPRGQWTVVAVNGQATGGGEHFRFEITPPTGEAQFGCNAGSGSLTAGNGWVAAGDWIITAAGCRNKQLARFERLGFAVTAKPMAVERRDGGIRLRNERGTIELIPAPPVPSVFGRWRVVAVNGRPVAGAANIAPNNAIINFGCNDLRAAYRQEGETLVPGMPVSTTERGCVTATGEPTEAAKHEDEGFRIAARHMQIAFYGPNRVRLSNEAGTIDLER